MVISDILVEDHKRVGESLERFIDSIIKGNPCMDYFFKARDSLHNHIFWEESVLFRAVEDKENSARIHGLEVEHGGIWKLLDKIEEYVSEGDAELAKDRIEGLIRVLETHNVAEEETVYRDLEEQDSSTQARLILFEIEQARPPEGWVCKIMRKYR